MKKKRRGAAAGGGGFARCARLDVTGWHFLWPGDAGMEGWGKTFKKWVAVFRRGARSRNPPSPAAAPQKTTTTRSSGSLGQPP